MTVLSLSKGVRGCTPSEYPNFFDKIVYFTCIACEYTWEFPLALYQDSPPEKCPLCNEFKYSAEWIVQDSQPFENEYIPDLITSQFIIEHVEDSGYDNIFDVAVYPETASLDTTSKLIPGESMATSVTIPKEEMSNIWTIPNTLGNKEELGVTCYDENDSIITPNSIEFPTAGSIVIHFSNAVYGYCHIRQLGIRIDVIIGPPPIFKKLVRLNNPDDIVSEPYFHRNMLTVLIDDPELAWKKAYITKEVRLFVED